MYLEVTNYEIIMFLLTTIQYSFSTENLPFTGDFLCFQINFYKNILFLCQTFHELTLLTQTYPTGKDINVGTHF